MDILPCLIKYLVKFPLEMSLFIGRISLYYQILLRGFMIYRRQIAAIVILEGVFLKKYYLIIVAQNCTARGFCYSGIISLLKGIICGIEQKLLSLKVQLEEVCQLRSRNTLNKQSTIKGAKIVRRTRTFFYLFFISVVLYYIQYCACSPQAMALQLYIYKSFLGSL